MKIENYRLAFVACASLLVVPLVGCEQAKESARAQYRNEMIQRLENAEASDNKIASDEKVTSASAADSALQARKAAHAISALQHGFEVPQSELDDALQVPPGTYPRAELIKEAKETLQHEHDEERLLYGDDTVGLDELRVRENDTSALLEDLETGEYVPWSQAQQTLRDGR